MNKYEERHCHFMRESHVFMEPGHNSPVLLQNTRQPFQFPHCKRNEMLLPADHKVNAFIATLKEFVKNAEFENLLLFVENTIPNVRLSDFLTFLIYF